MLRRKCTDIRLSCKGVQNRETRLSCRKKWKMSGQQMKCRLTMLKKRIEKYRMMVVWFGEREQALLVICMANICHHIYIVQPTVNNVHARTTGKHIASSLQVQRSHIFSKLFRRFFAQQMPVLFPRPTILIYAQTVSIRAERLSVQTSICQTPTTLSFFTVNHVYSVLCCPLVPVRWTCFLRSTVIKDDCRRSTQDMWLIECLQTVGSLPLTQKC